MSRIVVTGAAGFVGFHVAKRLLDRGDEVVGVDSLSPYYDVALKRGRLALLEAERGFAFEQVDLADRARAERLFATARADAVVHLAAQPGVRYSLENPHAYIDANVTAFLCVLEGCRHHPVRHLVYASSSSIYGGNTKVPFSVSDNVDRPISLYAATKKANELIAHSYSHLYRLPTTSLRFFTVYGPWGRPDMAPMLFTKAILEGKPIKVFNHGRMQRDFTYVDDIAEHPLRDVVHVGEVALHPAVVEHLDRLALEDRLREQHGRHVGPSPWPVDGEEPESGRRDVEQVRVGVRHQLVRLLGRGVEADRAVHVVGDGERNLGVSAVDGARGRVDEVPDRMMPAAFEDAEERGDVRVDVRVRVLERVADARLRGEVDDGVGAGGREQPLCSGAVGEIDLLEREAALRLEQREPAALQGDVVIGGEGVHPDDLVAAVEQPLRDVEAHEPCCPGDDDPRHGREVLGAQAKRRIGQEGTELLPVDVERRADHDLERELALDERPPRLAHPAAEGGILEQALHRVRDRRGVAVWHEEPVQSVPHDLSTARHVGRDDRPRASGGLDEHLR